MTRNHSHLAKCQLAAGPIYPVQNSGDGICMAAEIERDLISQRTKEALAAKKRVGMKLGRPKGSGSSKLDKHRQEIEALLAIGSTQRFIASRFNTTESNLSRWMKKHALKRKKQSE